MPPKATPGSTAAGPIVTTMNVGSFSALNGIAGAYAERLPVIFVAFDDAIRTALRERKPAYIEIACNLSNVPCVEPGPNEAITAPEEVNSGALATAVDRATAMLAGAKKPILLAGAHLRCSAGAISAFRDVAENLGCAVAVMPDAKGFFPEDHAQYVGTYWGPVSSPGCEAVMDWADLIVAAGPVFTDYTTAGWTGEPPAGKMINAAARNVRLPDAEYTNVAMADFLAGLAKNVRAQDATLTEYYRLVTIPAGQVPAVEAASAQLTRAELWRQIEQDLDPRSTLLCEGGDSWLSGAFTRLPGGARFEVEMQWGSLGWACPASFGYAMGLEPDRRLVSVIGDGSFQLAAQEVANMIRYGRRPLTS
jgi:pyruvate decarboxylase/indolepyruvate decarboxylase